MRKLWFIFLICVLISWAAANEKNTAKTFTSEKLAISFTYPANWLLNAEESDDYLSLCTPECFSHQEETPDLVSGLKIEVYRQETKADLNEYLTQNKFRKSDDHQSPYPQYESTDKTCLYLLTVIDNDKQHLIIIGYIPEKNKRQLYYADYSRFVSAIKLLP